MNEENLQDYWEGHTTGYTKGWLEGFNKAIKLLEISNTENPAFFLESIKYSLKIYTPENPEKEEQLNTERFRNIIIDFLGYANSSADCSFFMEHMNGKEEEVIDKFLEQVRNE